MAKLTQRTLEAIRPDQAGTTVRDDGGLLGRVRIKTDGSVAISFYYRYRFDGKSKDYSCGTWPSDGLSAIRMQRDIARSKVADGIDPGADKKVARHEKQEAVAAKLAEIESKRVEGLTVLDMFDAWMTDGVRRKDGNAQLKRLFVADILPGLGRVAIKAVTEHDIRAVLRALVDRGVNRTAVVARNSLTQMFAWAQKRQPWRKLMVDGNPMDLIEIDKIVSPDYDLTNQSDRILSQDEIVELRDLLRLAEDEYANALNKRVARRPLERTTQRGIWIMLSTLCRVGELSMARWEHVDLVAGEWFIPKENVKGSLADMRVYLSPFALTEFQRLYALTGHSDWCFPSYGDKHHIDTKSMTKQIGDRQAMFKKEKDGKAPAPLQKRRSDNTLVVADGRNGAWTPHDLRRTGATMMQALGVPLDTIDRCQNHVLKGSKVRRHYLHHDYASEKREAWRVLGARLFELLQPNDGASNVVLIGRAAA
ncbi:tyrosine-type recombinase/integrase [Massilia rhizosphaerae]|uniref:tyrosine-type recombinase/integrase n=1 Tax=Massilia rhizosphaerae TaxID=2784389 RepID=UPI0018DB6DD4|nr:site-specific integrase [Massilia rhizosphaerae]